MAVKFNGHEKQLVLFDLDDALYAFRKGGLKTFAKHKPGPVELAEGVEMLRFLESGYEVAMAQTPDDNAISFDALGDLEEVRNLITA